jgi:hypothetical protein
VIYDNRASSLALSEVADVLNETEIGPELMHEYKVINKGPSQFLTGELLIGWQRYLNLGSVGNKELFYLIETPYTEGPIKCNIQEQLVNPLNLSVCKLNKLILI